MSFAFGTMFQQSMLRLAIEDESFCALAVTHLRPQFFENHALGWIFSTIQGYHQNYGRPPTMLVLYETARSLDPTTQGMVYPTLEAVRAASVVESNFIGAKVVDFVKRNLFVESMEHLRNLFNAGNVDQAYEFFARRSDEINSISVGVVDRSFFFEEMDARMARRDYEARTAHLNTFPTGIPDLDTVLAGGLHLGELGIWVAYPKVGKSFMLMWLAFFAVRALRTPTLYFVLEGGREQAEDRFEAAFFETSSHLLKRGEVDHHKMVLLREEYRELKDLLVFRGFTKDVKVWNASITDFHTEMVDLKQRRGFVPKLVINDYGDLMRARKEQDNETAEQKAAFRDMKVLCGRDNGYAMWTASQAQRPPRGAENNPNHVVKASAIADCFEKVRVADFLGTLNRTKEEEAKEEMRIYAEMYRSAPAGRLITTRTSYSRSRIFTSVVGNTPLVVDPHAQPEIDF